MSNPDQNISTPSNDELLEQMHNDYYNEIANSGMPLWLLDYYGPVPILPPADLFAD